MLSQVFKLIFTAQISKSYSQSPYPKILSRNPNPKIRILTPNQIEPRNSYCQSEHLFENQQKKKKGSSDVTVDENFKLTLPIDQPGRCPSQVRF